MSDLNRRSFLTAAAASAALSLIGCQDSGRAGGGADDARGAGSIDGAGSAGSASAAGGAGASRGLGVAPKHSSPWAQPTDGLAAEDAAAPTMRDGQPALRLLMSEPDGSPLDAERAHTLHARDLHNDPLPQAITNAPGRARIELNRDEPIQISLRLKVPGFGEVYCYADNAGRGFTGPATIEFVIDAAATRLRRVREVLSQHNGLSLPRGFFDHLSAAARAIDLASFPPAPARIAAAYESLSHGLHAGEMLALAIARDRISRFSAPRHDFKFGILAAGAPEGGAEYQQRLCDAFNFATASWYTWRPEKFADTDPVDYARMDQSLNWCLANGIEPKTFGYLYMTRGAAPDYLRPPSRASSAASAPSSPSTLPGHQWTYDRIKDLYARVIRTTMSRYDGRGIKCAEIMNEAHDKANLWGLDHDQILDMARSAFTAAREGSKSIQRQMNHCCLWAEYAKRANPDGTKRWSPFQFIKACFDHGIDYEVIGLQLYYPQNDLFEIDRMLDRFLIFNRKLHITELATASQDGLDPGSMRPHTAAPGWHGPWSQSTQADWLEGIYTLVYAKPQFQEIGWWDFSDAHGRFWPFGGLLDAQGQPKESYHRLLMLQKHWGVGPGAKA